MSLNNAGYRSYGSGYRRNKSNINVDGLALYNRHGNHKSGLSCTMWNKMLKIAIMNYDEVTDTFSSGRANDHACIFLGQTKAFMLSNVLKKFKKDREKYNGYGVFTSKAIITILNGTSFGAGINDCAIRIVKFNDEKLIDNDGAYMFNTNNDYQYASDLIADDNVVEFTKRDDEPDLNDLELDLLITQLDEFVKATTFSQAYTTHECMSSSINQIKQCLDDIAPDVINDWGD